MDLTETIRGANAAADKLLAELATVRRERDKLLEILEDRSDVVDDADTNLGRPNEAMSILQEFEGWRAGWVK